MKLVQTEKFLKEYTQLPQTIRNKVDRQLTYLAHDIRHPGLYAKKMGGKDIWEARVDYHHRLTFQIVGAFVQLRRVGTHAILKQP